jgi:hypothetical protein
MKLTHSMCEKCRIKMGANLSVLLSWVFLVHFFDVP